LAHAPAGILEEIIAGGLSTVTSATPDAAHLRHQLAMIRSTGYCLTIGELDEHVAAIGVPIFMGRTLVAALSVAGPVDQFDTARLAVARDHLLAAGERLRRILEQSPQPAHLALASASSAQRPAAS
jgi:DNA-binding IclR family transcriptional regulator